MTHTTHSYFEIGADVSKNDIFFVYQSGSRKIANSIPALKAFLTGIARSNTGPRVTCESTGSYHDNLALTCLELGIAVSIVNPVDVKAFIRSFGSKAKTDPIDAHYIRHFAVERKPSTLDHSWIQRREAKELMSFRSRLVDERARLKGSLDKTRHKLVIRQTRDLIRLLTRRIDKVETEIGRLITDDPEWNKVVKLMQKVQGVGPQVSRTLAIHMPELGRVNRQRIANLAGLAPMHRDSGQMQGRRMIRHGRKEPRKALYQAAVVAMRFNDEIRTFYHHLKAKGKPSKVCLVACAHKLLIHINGLVRKEYCAI